MRIGVLSLLAHRLLFDPAPPATEPAAPPALTAEAVDKMVSTAVERALTAYQARQQSANKPPENTSEPGTVKEQLAALQAQHAKDKLEAQNERREAAIQQAIASHGIDTDKGELLYDHLHSRYGAAISVEGKSVIYVDPTTAEKISVKDLVGNVLKTKGDMFRPAVQTPSTRGVRPSFGQHTQTEKTYAELSPDERGKLTQAQAWEHVARDFKRK